MHKPKANSLHAVGLFFSLDFSSDGGQKEQQEQQGAWQAEWSKEVKANKVICFWIWNNLVFVHGGEGRAGRLGGWVGQEQ